MRHDDDLGVTGEDPAGGVECRTRHVHEVHGHGASGPGRQERGEFQTASRPEFDEGRKRIDKGENVARPALEEPLFGPGDLVPRQVADRLEERRSKLAVQMFGRELTRLL